MFSPTLWWDLKIWHAIRSANASLLLHFYMSVSLVIELIEQIHVIVDVKKHGDNIFGLYNWEKLIFGFVNLRYITRRGHVCVNNVIDVFKMHVSMSVTSYQLHDVYLERVHCWKPLYKILITILCNLSFEFIITSKLIVNYFKSSV